MKTRIDDPSGAAPKPVSLEDGRRAVDDLRARGRVNIDAFLSKLDVTRLLDEPVGLTPLCLTLNQLEHFAFNPLTELPHLANCDSCKSALRAYRAVKERSIEPLPNPFGAPDPIRAAFGVAVPEIIQLVPAEFEFDVLLQAATEVDLEPADLLVANLALGDIRCDAINMVSADADAGWTYRARCVARPNLQLVGDLAPGAEFVDWIEVSGKDRTGHAFAASDLARFSVKDRGFTVGISE